jgi:hypothetical protein
VINITGVTSYPVTITFSNQHITSSAFSLAPPTASVTINSSGTATTTYSGGQLLTVVKTPSPGNYFLSGYIYKVPVGGIAGGLNPVTWSGDFTSSESGVSINWQWAAAVYTSFSNDFNVIGIKPIDAPTGSIYNNSDHAGTPETYKSSVIGGARGGGGSNYTGSYSGTGSLQPCSNYIPAKGMDVTQIEEPSVSESGVILNNYPNPFTEKTKVIFSVPQDDHIILDVYDVSGKLVQKLFNNDVSMNREYNVEFDGNGLPSGIYIYKMTTNSEVYTGKMLLMKN